MNLLSGRDVALDLERHLQDRIGGRVRNLHVYRRDGRVIIEGSSQSFHAKQLATHALLERNLDEDLVNDIVVDRLDH